jgi:CRISPR-associated protein Csm5
MKQFLHNYKLKLTTISPIHIGDGDMYDPTNYFIKDGYLHYFDSTVLISKLNQEQRKSLIEILSRPNSYQQLQLFYRREDIRAIASNSTIYKVEVSKDIEENYENSLGKIKHTESKGNEVFNSLSINSTIKTSNIPYIPGSSFKGALKTAFFSKEAENKSFTQVSDEFKKYDKNAREKIFKEYKFVTKYFGEFEEDPFSKIKISDFTPKEPKLQIKWAVNKKKKSDTTENDNTAVRFEFIASDNEFVSELVIMELLKDSELEEINKNIRDKRKLLKQPSKKYIKDEIIKIANSFYIPKFEQEKSWAESKSNQLVSGAFFQRAKPFIEKAKQNRGFLVRVGRHSGAVSMTIDSHRKIFIPQMKKDKDGNNLSLKQKHVNEPFTYWLESDNNSVQSTEFIGWVYCEFIEDSEYQELIKLSDSFIQKQKDLIEKELQKLKEIEEQTKEEAKQKALQKQKEAEEAKRKDEEERAKREAALAAMSPVEKIIDSYDNLALVINAMRDGSIENYEDIKIELAQKIKEELQKNPKEWERAKQKALKRKEFIESLLS